MFNTAAGRSDDGQIIAMLGPTNTGKTHYAIERMVARADGIIGLPLRLLAREVYDRVVALRGVGMVALITGEEKIQPKHARYFVCTVEAMPMDRMVDFVAIDEVQMCGDPERGHIFTDRLLRARGRYETLFLGSDAARPRIQALVPGVRFVGRERFSTLTWTGSKKISRLKPRTAIVAFSIDQVYAIAELIRRQRGGAAVVMGALSPRTRNAQVALYQQGDVDYLVATDAVGMGLNLDVDHVAFAGLSKFDGQRHRRLEPNELAQIAGRAGRHTADGTFGVTGEAPLIDEEVVDAIEQHRFKPIPRFLWRNPRLDFGSVPALLNSLEQTPDVPDLARAREADDQLALRQAWDDPDTRRLANRPDRVRLLWEVCQIPDFRKVAGNDHAALVCGIYQFLLKDSGVIPSDWISAQVRRIDRIDGDIDTLSKRLAFVRTWTFVTNRTAWVQDAADWQARTRDLEDRLSDALHARLTQRFVDRRTSVLLRRLKQKERLVAEVNDKGEVMVEGEYLGRLDGFRFTVDPTATGDEVRTLRSASLAGLQAELVRRADKLYNAPDPEIEVTEQGGLMWGSDAVGKLVRGDDRMTPKIQVFVEDTADPGVVEKVERRLHHWVQRRITALFEPLVKIRDDETVTGLARGVAFRLSEEMGVIPRREIADDIKALGQDERSLLRKHGVRFGQHTIFLPPLLKPAPTRMRVLLWSLWQNFDEFPSAPPPGQVTLPALNGVPHGFYEKAGYKLCNTRAVRIDMLERLADMIRPMDQRAGFEPTADMLSITGCTLDQLAEIVQGLGFDAERGERPKSSRPATPVRSGRAGAKGAARTEPAPGADPTPATTDMVGAAPEAVPYPMGASLLKTAIASAQPTAETPEAMSGTAPEGTPDTTETAKPVEMETFFTFRLRPRRSQGQGPRRNRDSDASGDAATPQGERGPRRGRGPGPKTDASGPTAQPSERQNREDGPPADRDGRKPRRPARKPQGDGAPPRESVAGKPPRQTPSRPAEFSRPRRDDKPIDPDSPFAILQRLKTK